jgi:photosystem II stability/assembly factor-like uncharacterized protein
MTGSKWPFAVGSDFRTLLRKQKHLTITAVSPTSRLRQSARSSKVTKQMTTPLRNSILVFALTSLFAIGAAAQNWVQLGPDGGDVRTLTRDPHQHDRILLTTSAGVIYESLNGGKSWARFAHLGAKNDYVLDGVVFHPTRPGTIYIAAWSVETTGGELFRSHDGGRTWKSLKDMEGKSVRALAMAPSNPNVLVAGALDGVFRTTDGGEHWNLISPPDHVDIRNIESIAIDPTNAEIVYAGTWHLPWKTSDGGLTWKNIKQGIIDDSDVFSIIIDPNTPSTVYASACSGIYKSENAGETFRKVQGIPFSARRTRVLMQDPVNPDVVYAGTTEGLWKTVDAGKTWSRTTPANLIINDVLVDPANPGRVMLATDRSGVLASNDHGRTFTAANRGFAHRQVAAVMVDREDPSRLYAGVINDKEFGGVFVSKDSGDSWQQMSSGLNGLDVFALRQSAKGDLLAGTNKGIYIYRQSTNEFRWKRLDVIDSPEISPKPRMITKRVKGKLVKVAAPKKPYTGSLNARVNEMEITPTKWFAAASSGLYASTDGGKTWHGGIVEGVSEFIAVHSVNQTIAASGRRALIISTDGGMEWEKVKLPPNVTTLSDVTLNESHVYIASREGAYRSGDAGQTWEYMHTLPVNNVASIVHDEETKRLYATSTTSTEMFVSSDKGEKWQRADTGWLIRSVRPAGRRVVATTAFDGIVAQPVAAEQHAVGGGGQ